MSLVYNGRMIEQTACYNKTMVEGTSKSAITAGDVARYFVLKTTQDGELISPLKMQKLVYYAYAWHLAHTKEKLFSEHIEAWANGPVVPSLYRELKVYGFSPIDPEKYAGVSSRKNVENIVHKFSDRTRKILDDVYEKYQTMTAFELVVLTHQEKPWREARKGLAPDETSSATISDEHIFEQYHPA